MLHPSVVMLVDLSADIVRAQKRLEALLGLSLGWGCARVGGGLGVGGGGLVFWLRKAPLASTGCLLHAASRGSTSRAC